MFVGWDPLSAALELEADSGVRDLNLNAGHASLWPPKDRLSLLSHALARFTDALERHRRIECLRLWNLRYEGERDVGNDNGDDDRLVWTVEVAGSPPANAWAVALRSPMLLAGRAAAGEKEYRAGLRLARAAAALSLVQEATAALRLRLSAAQGRARAGAEDEVFQEEEAQETDPQQRYADVVRQALQRPPRDTLPLNDVLDRLLAVVVPNHASLTEEVELSGYDARCVETLASSFPADRSLKKLSIQYAPRLGPASAVALADMVRRNVRVQSMAIDPSGLGASGCKAICDSVVENAHLERLRFEGERRFEPGPDTFAAALGARSRLKEIQVQATWTVAAFVSFVHHLRTNDVLEKVSVSFQHQEGNKNLPIGLVEELLSKYNFTLKTVILVPASGEMDSDFWRSLFGMHERVMALLERNRRAREANSRLRDQPHEWDG